MKAVVVIEYDLADDAPASPFPGVMDSLREQLLNTEYAKAVQAHLGVRESADAVLAVFTNPPPPEEHP